MNAYSSYKYSKKNKNKIHHHKNEFKVKISSAVDD